MTPKVGMSGEPQNIEFFQMDDVYLKAFLKVERITL